MSKILGFFLIAMLTYASAVSVSQAACQYIVKAEAMYNFFGFKANTTSCGAGTDCSTISFDLCNPTLTPCTPSGNLNPVLTYVTASVDSLLSSPCINIADTRAPTATYVNPVNSSAGVTLTYPSYNNGGTYYQLIVNVNCDPTIDLNNMAWDLDETISTSGNVFYTLTATGSAGCPVITLSNYLEFFENWKVIFAAVFLIIGLFALLAGLKFFNITIFIFTFICVSAGIFIIIFALTGLETSTGIQWLIFIICCFIGLACGYGAVKLEKAGFFALGSLFGGLGALFLYSVLLHFFDLSEVALYIIIVVCALVGGGLSLWLWKDIIILATSCIGSYLVVRGCSFYIGGFPNEIAVAEGLETYDYVDYVYLAFIVLIAVGGMVYQFRRKKMDEENEKEIQGDSITRY